MMRSSMTPPIEQQMYTRERRGVFRTTEGFDTVAASPGLDPAFIKKVLHPYCVYDAPAELTGRGEKDESKFPASMHLLHLESGETILGQNVYQATDFTGLRSAFFAHNYVLSPASMEEQMKRVDWLDTLFATSYDIEQGTELPALSKLPVTAEDAMPTGGSEGKFGLSATPNQILGALKIDETLFKRMLYAVMQSVAARRKVYIALDVAAEEVTAGAKALLRLLYRALPYAFRRQLGFMTFAKEPQAKKGIHVQFVERGTLRPKDRNTEKDFTFDLVSGRVTHADASVAKLPYAEFAWFLVQDQARAAAYYEFADEMLAGMEPGRDLSIEAYGELSVFYSLEQGVEDLYLNNKSEVLSGLLTYLKPEGAQQQRARLNELFLTLLSRELDSVRRENVPEEAVASRFGEYFRVAAPVVKTRIVDYFIYAANNARAQKRMRAVQELYAILDRDVQLHRAFFGKVLNNASLTKLLFEPYLDHQLKQTETAAGIIELVQRWVTAHPSLLQSALLLERSCAELRERLCSAPDPVESANKALQRVSVLDRITGKGALEPEITGYIGQSEVTSGTGQQAAHSSDRSMEVSSGRQQAVYQEALTKLADKLAYVINLYMIQDLDLERVNRDQLLQIDILQHGDEVRDWAARQGADVSARTNMMLVARAWLSGDDNAEEAIESLSLAERDELQRWTRRWLAAELQSHAGPAAYEALALAFYRGGSGSNRLDYSGLIQFVRSHTGQAEVLYAFFEWSGSQRMFVRASNAHKGYADAIINYFKSHDREAFRSKSAFRPYYAKAGKAMKPIYDRAKAELSSPLMRMLTGRKKKRWLGLLLLILIVGIAGGTYALMSNKAEPQAQPPAEQEPVVPAHPEEQLPDYIAYIVPSNKQEGKASQAELVIRFRSETGGIPFEKGKLQLLMDDQSMKELDVTEQWRSLNTEGKSNTTTAPASSPDSSAGNSSESKSGTREGAAGAADASSGSGTDDSVTGETDGAQQSSDASKQQTESSASGKTGTDQGKGEGSADAEAGKQGKSGDQVPSGGKNAAGNRGSSKPLTAAEADRLYRYGMQLALPKNILPEHVVSIQQGAEGSEIVIDLMQEPS
ncbi:hypothetical protein HUB98_14760 [Paenibacillus barcinonensis]|uniref:Glycosyltransferase n=2 Tax=Paenibacillus barcinonensis TaxID=198119 RepID=A0ABX6Q5V1_PAEBA|nr:hypothetical protein [Paenibacillus barcinonensis]QKS57442.1 hypothetical protein HUB98_14760 [Paenibacillus barcinonensis]